MVAGRPHDWFSILGATHPMFSLSQSYTVLSSYRHEWLSVVTCVICLVGCDSGPKHPALTTFDVDEVAQLAMQQLDTESDGQLSRDELRASPGLLGALAELDTNRDRQLSFEELRARLQLYIDARVAIHTFPILVTKGGQPLVGATVKLFPEEFLAAVIEPAEGMTDDAGHVFPSIAVDPELRERGTQGFRSGVYRVEVSKVDDEGKELIPARYNVDSDLGLEIKMEEHMETIRIDL